MVELWWRHPVRFAPIEAPRGERRDLVVFTKPSCRPMVKVVFVLHSKHHIFPVVLLPVFQCSFFRYSLNVQFLFHVYLDERTAGLFCTWREKKKKEKQKTTTERWKLISLLFAWLFGCLFSSVWDYTQRTIASAVYDLRMETENEHFACQDRGLSQIQANLL